jgi:hypothetical protein
VSEKSVQCPVCPFQFARLVDAGGYSAYHCTACDWSKATSDTRPGNRPADMCALCDTPISPLSYPGDHHLYVGPGMVHGGGREHIPVHGSCLSITHWPEGSPAYVRDAGLVAGRLAAA